MNFGKHIGLCEDGGTSISAILMFTSCGGIIQRRTRERDCSELHLKSVGVS
jgi:hypothetical protein